MHTHMTTTKMMPSHVLIPGSFWLHIADQVQQLYAKSKLDLSRCRGRATTPFPTHGDASHFQYKETKHWYLMISNQQHQILIEWPILLTSASLKANVAHPTTLSYGEVLTTGGARTPGFSGASRSHGDCQLWEKSRCVKIFRYVLIIEIPLNYTMSLVSLGISLGFDM